MDNLTYITQTSIHQQNGLRAYVNKLSKKVDYAMWKQNLILCYNYLPLANLLENIQKQYDNYKKKMDDEQQKQQAMVDNQQFLQMLNNLTKFRIRLLSLSQQFQLKIHQQRQQLIKLKHQCKQRKQQLKIIIKNYKYHYMIKQQQLFTYKNINNFVRTASTATNANSLTTRSSKNWLGDIYNDPLHNNIKQIFQNCINSIKLSNKHDGYKQLNKNKSNEKKQISRKVIKKANNNSQQQQKNMRIKNKISWECFNQLNFHQILSIIHQKDPNLYFFYHLL